MVLDRFLFLLEEKVVHGVEKRATGTFVFRNLFYSLIAMPRDNSHGDIVYQQQERRYALSTRFYYRYPTFKQNQLWEDFPSLPQDSLQPKILFNQLPAGCWEKAPIAPAICHNKPNTLLGWSTVLQ